jgi:heme A synthase
VTELLLLALAGLLVGAGLSAAKRGAPRPLYVTFHVMAALALVLAAVTFPRDRL